MCSAAFWPITLEKLHQVSSTVHVHMSLVRINSRKVPALLFSHWKVTTCKECTLTGAQRETLMFNVTVQWRIIINDPFNSPTNMNVLGIARGFKSFTTEMLKMDTKEDQKGRQTQAMWVNV